MITEQVRTRYRYYQRNRVEVLFGQARLVDANHVDVLRPDGVAELLHAQHIVIATGSRPLPDRYLLRRVKSWGLGVGSFGPQTA